MRRPCSRRIALLAAATVLGVLCAVPGAVGAEEPRASDVYVRRRMGIAEAVDGIVADARRRGVGQLLFVFDAATFAPPPGETEFSMDRLYPSDLPSWIHAIGSDARDAGCPIRATSSLAQTTIAVGEAGWKDDLRALVTRSWWDDDDFQEFEPAARWINRLLLVTESALGEVRGDERRMLVLVSGSFTPERWVSRSGRPLWEGSWRNRLRRVGTYWDEEAIAARLQRDGCLFYAVAPEAHFCDFRPFVELPELPWASRPIFPVLRFGSGLGSSPTTPVDPLDAEALRRRLRERRGTRGGRLPGPTTPGALPPGSPPPPLQHSGWRFESFTPYWFRRTDGTLLVNNHAPSGYGYWPFARVAAKTGGRYYFYPFPDTRWLDRCPADGGLLDRLAPDLVNRIAYLSRLQNDPALDAIVRATRLVVDETPWTDDGMGRTASGWGTFRRVAPLAYEPDWFLRRKPFEVVFEDPADARRSLMRTGARIEDDVLPLYDRAISILDKAILAEAAGPRQSRPRSVADLFLARYWFAMSAFHLQAFSIYAQEIERFIPDSLRGKVDRWWVVYIPTIKMSDGLDAYDGRELSPSDEALYPRWVLPDQPGMQGNILLIDGEDPNYRAKRKLGFVLDNLDPRLRHRALDMIYAARRVMDRYAESGWGWTTYYSVAYTFIFRPMPEGDGPPPRRPGQRKPTAPTTPSGPDVTPGGSNPGGPTTGG